MLTHTQTHHLLVCNAKRRIGNLLAIDADARDQISRDPILFEHKLWPQKLRHVSLLGYAEGRSKRLGVCAHSEQVHKYCARLLLTSKLQPQNMPIAPITLAGAWGSRQPLHQ